jgi:hypothetical protein
MGATGDAAGQAAAGTYPASGIQSGATADQAGSMGSTGATGTSANSGQDMTTPSSSPMATSTMPNSTVISIEPMGSASGSTESGSSGTSGSAGATGAQQQAYRVTLRMDDGSTQVVSQATPPTYRSGDRVSLGGGVISR